MSYSPPTGSTVAFQSDATKLVGTMSVVGLPVTQNISGSVFATGSITALQGTNPWTVTGFPTNQNISGSVFAVGSITALQGTNPWTVTGFPTTQNISGSVFAVGSITALQGTNPWAVQLTSGSIITTGGNSSVTVMGTVPASVSGVGIFNTNHIGSGSIFTAFRNDAIASTVGVNLTSRLVATDSAGRTVTKPLAPEEAVVRGNASTVNIAATSLLGAAGAGLKNYIAEFMVSNTGSVPTLVTFINGDGTTIGKTIAPAYGGSNKTMAIPMVSSTNEEVHFKAGTATSVLHIYVSAYKAP